jgi:4-amino-4-deoxy-L-arabinose transferase-like glycosyltransferase
MLGPRTAYFGWAILALVAAWAFFWRLGDAPLNDWDEAWHAQVASEILTSGDWVTLHYRGEPYFNKPPMTFWLKALAFRVHGVNEASARFFPALFGWATVMLAAGFFARTLGRAEGWLAGMILCTSWLFTSYHAGRSAEADSTLIFFSLLTFVLLWRAAAASRVGWIYAAALSTAAAWTAKGSVAFLPWFVAALPLGPKRGRGWWRHVFGGAVVAYALTLPWAMLMLWRHGRTFASAFYLGEGVLPALAAIENHPGDWRFYPMILHAFCEPWLALAGAAAIGAVIARGAEARRPVILWLVAWAMIVLGSCTLFSTKMLWYATPAIPAIAGLAAAGIVQLARRPGGWVVLGAAAALGAFQLRTFYWGTPSVVAGVAIAVVGGILIAIPVMSEACWSVVLAAGCAVAPLGLHGYVLRRVIARAELPTNWTDLRAIDEPWREVAEKIAMMPKASRGGRVVLLDRTLRPAGYFYVRRALGDQWWIGQAPAGELANVLARSEGQVLVIVRKEQAEELRRMGFGERIREGALVVMSGRREPAKRSAAAPRLE